MNIRNIYLSNDEMNKLRKFGSITIPQLHLSITINDKMIKSCVMYGYKKKAKK